MAGGKWLGVWAETPVGAVAWPCPSPFPLLSPAAAPHFPEPLGDLEVEIGDSVTLLCRAEGSLPLQVAWSRQDGKPVVQQHGLPGAELLIDGER